ncbi:MAG: type II/IV secretion system protein [Verrucomicrobiales bacterium]|nr:type II/IV secretion system protein [Verrucomicrobiales bacterium]
MNPGTPDRGLADRLLSAGVLNPEQLELASAEQRRRGIGLLSVVAELGLTAPEKLSEFLAGEADTRAVNVLHPLPDPGLLEVLPLALARRLRVAPVAKSGNTLALATSDPFNIVTLDLLRHATGCDLDVVIAPERDILTALDRMEATAPTIHEAIDQVLEQTSTPASKAGAGPETADTTSSDAPVIALVNQVITKAVTSGASDLHVEPQERMVRLRLRNDGVLRADVLVPKALQSAVTARLKLIGNLDVTETRLPQDGRTTVLVDRKPVNLRLSSLPTQFGESVVVRILDPGAGIPGLKDLGLSETLESEVRDSLASPHGVFLTTGPTGSGKTTTLYSLLQELNRPEIGIFTLEDPVEMTVPGIRQTQVREDIGLTFGAALRSLLRQDPDVILVGETRDTETATLMVRAALTGHLVFSTLHTNDAPGAIPRLLDMGVEPCLLPDSLIAVMAQRLVRRLCLQCRQPATEPLPGANANPIPQPWMPCGCAECRDTGYRGRVALFELLRFEERFHDAVIRRAPHSEFVRLAREGGMRCLFEDGLRRIQEGITTLTEVVQAARQP